MSERKRRIEEYRDGGLSQRKRREVESQLEQDSGSAAEFRRLDALGGAIREAWNDAPQPPRSEIRCCSPGSLNKRPAAMKAPPFMRA